MTYSPQTGLFSSPLTQLDRIEKMLKDLTAPKKKSEPRGAKTHKFDEKFELIKADYPKVTGANWVKAYTAYSKRIKETCNPINLAIDIHAAVINYGKLCEATDRTVMLPATFFGPDKHYDLDWTIPKPKPEKPQPTSSTWEEFDPKANTEQHLDTSTNPYKET